MENERRKFTRFLVPENVYAALTRKRCGVRFYRFTDELRKRFEGFLKVRTIGAT